MFSLYNICILGTGGEVQLVECFPNTHKALGLVATTVEIHHGWNPSIKEIGKEDQQFKAILVPPGGSEASFGFKKPCLNKQTQTHNWKEEKNIYILA